jgi:catabolite regulation protein CreA
MLTEKIQRFIRCTQSSPILTEKHFLEMNPEVLEKQKEIFFKNLSIRYICHCVDEQNWIKNS